MQNITIGQIATSILFLVSLIGGVLSLLKYIKSMLGVVIKEEMEPLNDKLNNSLNDINKKIDCLDEKVVNNDLNAVRNYLLSKFNDIRNGEVINEVVKENIHKQMKRYEKNSGNGYLHNDYENLMKEGKI